MQNIFTYRGRRVELEKIPTPYGDKVWVYYVDGECPGGDPASTKAKCARWAKDFVDDLVEGKPL